MHCLSSNIVTVFFLVFLLVSPLTPVVATTPQDDEKDHGFLYEVCSRLCLNDDQCSQLGKASSFAIYAAAAAAVGAVGVPAILATMGFTATGITAGSWAAWYQATYGIGMAFSWLQGASMTGAAATLVTKLGVGAAFIKSYVFGDDCKKQSTKDEQCSKK